MTSFKVLGAALVFSALLATPASAWEPAAALAADPTFSIHLGHAWRRIGTVSTATSRKSYHRRQALSIALIARIP